MPPRRPCALLCAASPGASRWKRAPIRHSPGKQTFCLSTFISSLSVFIPVTADLHLLTLHISKTAKEQAKSVLHEELTNQLRKMQLYLSLRDLFKINEQDGARLSCDT